MLLLGDCVDRLKELPDHSVDSLVTDPPAGISFMGKGWDGDKGGRKQWCAWMESIMREALRVMKPGAHGLVWALPRTSHWTATALEDAGFEVRDCITHLFGSGFPKSMNVSIAIDKAAGAMGARGKAFVTAGRGERADIQNENGKEMPTHSAITPEAKQWQGFGTALKPAAEFWYLVRKPLSEKTVAANVLKWGTGALNIDGSRVTANWETDPNKRGWQGGNSKTTGVTGNFGCTGERVASPNAQGRFPANLLLSHSPYCSDTQCDIECAVMGLDLQAGQEASRYFYCAKISASERNAGLEGMPLVQHGSLGGGAIKSLKTSTGNARDCRAQNHHPTVKPQKLMRYLCKLVTPPNGTVLDPFMGSGSTGLAAKSEGFGFIGIEREQEYFEIAKARIG